MLGRWTVSFKPKSYLKRIKKYISSEDEQFPLTKHVLLFFAKKCTTRFSHAVNLLPRQNTMSMLNCSREPHAVHMSIFLVNFRKVLGRLYIVYTPSHICISPLRFPPRARPACVASADGTADIYFRMSNIERISKSGFGRWGWQAARLA